MIMALVVVGLVAAILLIWSIFATRHFMVTLFRMVMPLYRVEITGTEHLMSTGPVVYVANHNSLLDGPLLAALIPGRPEIVVHSSWAGWAPLRLLKGVFRISAIDPARPMSVKGVAKNVQGGGSAIIFPEGRISVTGAPMKTNPGAAWLIDNSRAPVCAIHIEGLERSSGAKPATGWRRVWFPKVRVQIEAPCRLDIDDASRGKLRRQRSLRSLGKIMECARFNALNRYQSIPAAIADSATIHGDKVIAYKTADGKTLARRDILLGGAVLERVIRREFKEKTRIGLLMPTAPGTMVVLMGLWRAQKVPAMINHTVGAASVGTAMNVIASDVILTSRAFIEGANLDALVADLAANGMRVAYIEDLKKQVGRVDKLAGMLGRRRISTSIIQADPGAILFTSGTEGAPKAVVLSHGNILANIAQLRARTDIGPKDISVSALPAFHSFGLTAGMILPLVCGIRTGLHPSPLHYRVIPALCYDMQATIMFGTDTFLSGWARRADPSDFASLRAVVAGAEQVKETTRKQWAEKFGVRVLEGYGATECSPVLSLTPPSDPAAGTVGNLLPAMEMRLEPVPGITGARLLVRGPNVMSGYMLADDPGVVSPPENGWYDTGDIVELDEAERIIIKGRVKRFAKVGGEMVSLQAVEELAAKVWVGVSVAAVNLPSARTGEQVILFVESPDANRAELVSFAKEAGVGSILLPAELRPIEAIPLLATGKVNYPRLKELAIST